MRKKEGNVDYKYFPEPNIFPIRLDEKWIEEIQNSLEELPEQRLERFKKQFGLNDYDASVLVNDRDMADFYESVMADAKDAKKAANWVIGDLSAWLNKNGLNFTKNPASAKAIARLVNLIEEGTISGKQGKEVFEDVMSGADPDQVIKDKGMQQMSDDGALLELINTVLDQNPKSIEDFKNGKNRAVGFLMGQVMKASKGQANPKKANGLLVQELNKR